MKELDIFAAALDVPDEEQEAFVRQMCADDEVLLRKVQALLKAHRSTDDFLDRPLTRGRLEQSVGAIIGEKVGDRIGRYKLVQQIGEGGWGVVFMAEQEEPVRRKVAFKIVKPGMDTKSIIARFEAERQALALMDHPNIAHIFDAGATESGRPYFVMELVQGAKITDYCDEHSLTTEARLELFMKVCDAVQHAHQKGIIHRDLKPSNVMVTTGRDGKPIPKVIDFGVAKATGGQQLTTKTIVTAHAMFIGTPDYMSPEQAALSSAELDTRTDIYSLGAMLYELLTGATPFDTRELLKAGIDEVRRAIRNKEPTRPSTRLTTMTAANLANVSKLHGTDPPKLIREMRGELDCIVLKALEKDRALRFQTADSLAADINRYLKNETVSARPPSSFYQFRKLLSRHRVGFTLFGIVLVTLLGGLSSTTWSLAKEKRARHDADLARHEADEQRKKAQIGEQNALTEAARSKAVKEVLEKMFTGVNPAVAQGRDTALLRDILDKTVEGMGQVLTNQPGVEADLKMTIGGVYVSLELYDKAEVLLQSALAFYRKSPGAEENVADVLSALSEEHYMQGKFDEAEKESREALAFDPSLQKKESMRRVLVETRLGWVVMDSGRPAQAEPIFRQALAMGQRLAGDDSEDVTDSRSGLAMALNNLGRLPEAESLLRRSLEVDQKIHGREHPDVANDMYRLAFVVARQHRLEEAEAIARQCVSIRRKVLGPSQPLFDQALLALAQLLGVEGKGKESAEVYCELLEVRRKRLGDENSDVADVVTALANTLIRNQDEVQFEELARNFPKAWIPRSEDWARHGHWSEALAAASRYAELRPDDNVAYHLMAPLLAQARDFRAYDDLCARITTRFAGATDPHTADRMAKDCLILPRPGADLSVPAKLAETAVKVVQKDDGSLPYFQSCEALAEYRLGHYGGAIKWAELAAQNPFPYSQAEALAVLSLAQGKLNQAEDARITLAKCEAVIQKQFPPPGAADLGRDWRDWIIARALLEEARDLAPPGH
jgi:eukaryotic-like serine/threonine-protein kinase